MRMMSKPYYKVEKLHSTIQHNFIESCQVVGSGDETRCHLSIWVDISQRNNLSINQHPYHKELNVCAIKSVYGHSSPRISNLNSERVASF